MADIEAALAKANELLDVEGVVGVGQGEIDGRECIVVFVAAPREQMEARLPREIEGVPVSVQESGPFHAGGGA